MTECVIMYRLKNNYHTTHEASVVLIPCEYLAVLMAGESATLLSGHDHMQGSPPSLQGGVVGGIDDGSSPALAGGGGGSCTGRVQCTVEHCSYHRVLALSAF
jgi:hypothetical protein